MQILVLGSMHISQVRTATKIADFALRLNHANRIRLVYRVTDEETLQGEAPRIYLIVQDGVIKKIGGSAARGGIKATMSFYVSAMQGSPGQPRFIIHRLIENALRAGSKVELHMIVSPSILAPVNGLFRRHKIKVASFKEMEDLCKDDYFSQEKRYPDWNFQENGEPYPNDLAREHNEYHKRRLARNRQK